MFNNSAFSSPSFGQQNSQPRYEDIMRQVQFNNMTQQNIYVQQSSMFDDYSKLIQELSQEEQAILLNNKDYVSSRMKFEQGFSEFLATKFKDEFIATKYGDDCMKGLMTTTKSVISDIQDEVRQERERLRALSKLLHDNPNLLDELTAAKATQLQNTKQDA